MLAYLPDEILFHIIKDTDYKIIISLYELSKHFNRFSSINVRRLLQEILKKVSKLNTRNYIKEELLHTCKIYDSKSSISIGCEHSLILTDDNILVYDDIILHSPGIIDKIATGCDSLISLENGDVYYINGSVPIRIPMLSNIISVASSSTHSLVLSSDIQVYSFTCHSFILSAIFCQLSNIIQIAAGNNYSMALTDDGNVYSCLRSENSVTTLITGLNNIIQISVSEFDMLALSSDNEVYRFKYNYFGRIGFMLGFYTYKILPTLICKLNNIVHVSVGINNAWLLMANGQVYKYKLSFRKEVPKLVSLNYVVKLAAFIDSMFLKSNGEIYVQSLDDNLVVFDN